MTGQRDKSSATIGIIGDRDAANPTHRATDAALAHVPDSLPFAWVGTEQALAMPVEQLRTYAGFLIAPGSPYRSMEGALRVIRLARESGIPLLGTCGGFQHVVVEYARTVLGVMDADHEETGPDAEHLAVTALTCSLAGQQHSVSFLSGSRVAAIYGVPEAVEPFFCRFGLNPAYRSPLEERGLCVSGFDREGEPRVIELAGHPFYLATLYVPQARSTPEAPHPLITAFVAAARGSLPILSFPSRAAWDIWLADQHMTSKGLWLKIAKKGSGIDTVSYAEALDVALCYGWIDGQKAGFDDAHWLQRFTPRRARSKWSKINCDRAEELMRSGEMQPAGLREVERAQADGRWDAAYEPQSAAVIPDDLQRALDQNPRAQAFFATLDKANRYAILYRIREARKPETRTRRIETYVAMLSEGKKLHL